MAWYVFALVDRLPAGRQGRGLAGAIGARRVPGGFAIVERRADVPPVELGTLKAHNAVVARLAGAVPAILPVRFGTLLEMAEIEAALDEREEEIAEAFERVRGRVQFTWRQDARSARRARGVQRARGAAGAGSAGVAGERVLSGAEYLRQAARAAEPPAAFRSVREQLRPLIVAERFQPSTPALPGSLYHLVERTSEARYRLVAARLAASSPKLRVTGPFPTFAFTPDLL